MNADTRQCSAHVQYQMRLMIISADARCVIEVGQETLAGRDLARPLELKVAAFDVLRRCMTGPRSTFQGGIAEHLGKTFTIRRVVCDRRNDKTSSLIRDLGEGGNLAVVLMTYEPNVECIEPQTPVKGLVPCQRTLNKLSASKEAEYFGNSDASEADVRLPKSFDIGELMRSRAGLSS